jgi:hypothetical protein
LSLISLVAVLSANAPAQTAANNGFSLWGIGEYVWSLFGAADENDQPQRARGGSPFIESGAENVDPIKSAETPPASLASPCNLNGATLNVPGTYSTIQAAINAANPSGGDKIVVAAGTYTEQLIINKCLSITGAGEGQTIIQAPTTLANSTVPGVNARSLVEVRSEKYVTISNLTITGLNAISTSGNDVYGVFVVDNATAKMTDVTVSEIRDAVPANRGLQNGNAIRAGSVTANQIGSLELTRVTVEKYQKTGIIVSRNNSTATIDDSDIVGEGAQNYIAQNGIQVNDNATLTITNSRINKHLCDVVNPQPQDTCSFTNYYSYAVFTLESGAVNISGTVFDNNDGGIYNWAPSATSTITGNVFTNTRYAGIDLDQGTTNISNNYIVGSSFGPIVGVAAYSYNGNTGNTIGNLQMNSITGASQANIELTDLNTSDTAIPVVTANFNRLSGNARGVNNTTTASMVNAENNFWGCNAGPQFASGNGCSTISNMVDADPWLVLDDTVSTQSSVNTGGTTTVTTSLRRNSNGVDTYALPGNPHLPNPIPGLYAGGIPVNFSATFGTVNPTTTPLVNGLASTTFTGGGIYSGDQTAVVTAQADNATDTVNITVEDTTAPTVTINQAVGQPDPTTVSPVNFTVVFSEVVTGFDAADIDTTGTTATIGTPVVTTSDNQTFNVAIPATSSGVVIANVAAGAALDPAGNANATAATTGNTPSTDNIISFFVGAINLVVDEDGSASATDCDANVPAYTTIQSAVNAASAGYTIRVCPGTFVEDVNVNKANLLLQGSGIDVTTIVGPFTGPLSTGNDTVLITAANVTVDGFTITRNGNTAADWNSNPQNQGVNVAASANFTLQNSKITGNRNGIYIGQSSGNATIRRNIIDFNRTGVHIVDNNNSLLEENFITNNWTIGVLYRTEGGPPATTHTVRNNKISGNWYSQIENRDTPGTAVFNASGNYLGTTSPTRVTTTSLEEGYSTQIPVEYGGTDVAPANETATIAGPQSARVDYSPFLNSGTDTQPGVLGFQGDFSNLWVTADNPQASGSPGKIQEGVNLATTGGTVNVLAGSYTENVNVNKPLSLLGPNAANDPNTGTRVAEAIIYSAVSDADPNDCDDLNNSAIVKLSAEGVTVKGFTLDGDNPALTSNFVVNGADIDSYIAVEGQSTTNPNADLSYNIVKNFGEFGLVLSGNDAAGARVNSTITRNKLDNIVGLCYGQAVRIGENAFANVTNNVVTKSFNGVTIENFNGNADNPNPRPISTVGNNQMTVFGYAIYFNLHYNYTANGFTVSNNTINAYVEAGPASFANLTDSKNPVNTKSDAPRRFKRQGGETRNELAPSAFWDRFIGIRIESIQQTVPVAFTGNTIAPNRAALNGGGYTVIDGIRITNPSTATPNLNITENSISNNKRGIAHTAANAVPNVSCNNILANDVGIYVGDGIDFNNNPESATSGILANNNNIVGNTIFGVEVAASIPNGVTNAENNYWGAADGPGPVGPGSGDKVTTKVDFTPFLNAPATCTAPTPAFPTVTINQAAGQNDPTNAAPINFTVTFSEPVTGFDASDVVLGGTAGATTALVTGGPTVYNVAVSGMTGTGTVTASVIAGAAISNATNNPNTASTSTDNTVVYDVTAPTVTINQAGGQSDPATSSPINFTVVFSEPVTGFATGDVTITGTAFGPNSLPMGVVTQIAPNDGTTYNVAVSGMNTSGTVVVTIAAGVAVDAATNANAASTSSDNTVQFNQPAATNVLVSPVNTQGWVFANESTAGGVGSYVVGPATPPLPIGSARLQVSNGLQGQTLQKQDSAYAGTRFDQITQLEYSSYQNTPSNPQVAIAFQFNLDEDLTDGNTAFQGRLIYEPTYDSSSTVQQNVWQSWNLLSPTARFWASASANSTIDTACTQSNPCTRAQILASYPNLGFHPTLGIALFKVGSGVATFDGNVDNLIIGVNSSNTVFNFEPTPPTISIDDVTVTEGNSGTVNATFTITQSAVSTLDTTVSVSTADGTATTADNDYVAFNQTVTIPAGQTSATVTILVNGDNVYEPTETFTVNLSNAANAAIVDGQGIGTISEEDQATVSISSAATPASLTEGDSGTQTATFTVSLSNPSSQPITVSVTPGGTAATPGDFTLDATTLTFAPGETTKTVTATIVGDNSVESDETFTATIAVTSGTVTLGNATGTGTITNDDAFGSLQFSAATYSVTEGTPTATITVTRTGGNDGAVSVTCSTVAGGTATAGSDYAATTQVISFADQDAAPKTCSIPITNDNLSEPSETVNLALSNVTGGATIGSPSTAVLTINDNGNFVSISGNIQQYNAPSPNTNLAGVTVTLSGSASATTTTDANGNYTFNGGLPTGGSFLVTPTMSGKTFDPISRNYSSLTTNVTNANFIAYNNGNIPRKVRIGLSTVVPGQQVTVPIELVSLGNENGVSFSFTYDTALLSNPSVALGSDASNATLIPNTNTAGFVGVVLALPSGQTFTAGTRQIVKVTFNTVPTSAYNTPLNFVNSPVTLKVSDASANPLPAEFVNGFVVFSQGLEADVDPRPNGDNDVDVGDFIQVGQFAAALATPDFVSSNEFQRADNEPTASKGNGTVDLGDFIQAGRYAATLDPVQTVGGPAYPTAPPPFAAQLTANSVEKNASVPRVVKVVNATASPGNTVTVSLEIDAEAGDKGASFTLDYDQTKLTSPQVALGSGASGGFLIPNTNNPGKVIVQLAFITGGFQAGVSQLVTIKFTVLATAPAGTTPLTFNDTPVERQVRDTNNVLVDSNFMDGTVNILAPTSASVLVAGRLKAANGRAVSNAEVVLTDGSGGVRTARSNAFGIFRFLNVPVGGYVISVRSKRFSFTPRVLNLNDDLTDLILTAEP